jgi:hypothetical protein
MNELAKDHCADPSLETWLGRRQAYSLMAGSCSAADAKCLHEIRENKEYKELGLTWEEFCRQRVGMSRSNADLIIRQWKELGPTYFTLHQLTGVTADEYRAIRGAVEDGSLRWRDATIPIQAEQAPRLLEAVREPAPPPPPRSPKPPQGAEGEASPYRVAEEALVGAHAAIKRLRQHGPAPAEHQRLDGLISTLALEMRLISRLSG